ncbi:MAG: L-histidine N(alpha)-methyltransferase, partial [Rhizobiales bacterium]|nr:L-histidine N(alpha)-methyltransferase [Hyphomicrobiales bacterium]
MATPARQVSGLDEANISAAAFAADVMAGLGADPKRLPPKYFYDTEGSRLFERITELPEYYPTRTEIAILEARAVDIAALIPDGAVLIEFGAGSCRKTRIVFDAAPQLSAFVPVDISGEFLRQQSADLRKLYPKLPIHPVVADISKPFVVPETVANAPRAGFFPGSTIGNFEPYEAAAFMRHAGNILGRGAICIVGVDTVKDTDILNAAYNDAEGVTARFNLNILTRINRELKGN